MDGGRDPVGYLLLFIFCLFLGAIYISCFAACCFSSTFAESRIQKQKFLFIVATSFMYHCPCFRKISRNIDFTTVKSQLLCILMYVKFLQPFSLCHRQPSSYYQDD